MSKLAIIKFGSSQFKVTEGDEITVDKLEGEKGKNWVIKEVLLLADKKIEIGQPYVKGAGVKVSLVDQAKGEKVRIATFKAKTRYRKVKGFRSQITRLKIEKISCGKS